MLRPAGSVPVLDRFTTSFSDHEPVSSRLLPDCRERACKRRAQIVIHACAQSTGNVPVVVSRPMSLLAHRRAGVRFTPFVLPMRAKVPLSPSAPGRRD